MAPRNSDFFCIKQSFALRACLQLLAALLPQTDLHFGLQSEKAKSFRRTLNLNSPLFQIPFFSLLFLRSSPRSPRPGLGDAAQPRHTRQFCLFRFRFQRKRKAASRLCNRWPFSAKASAKCREGPKTIPPIALSLSRNSATSVASRNILAENSSIVTFVTSTVSERERCLACRGCEAANVSHAMAAMAAMACHE